MKRSDITDEQVVRACAEMHSAYTRSSIEILLERTGAPDKVGYAAMARAEERGLIDYGTSLSSAWPTPEGLALLDVCAP